MNRITHTPEHAPSQLTTGSNQPVAKWDARNLASAHHPQEHDPRLLALDEAIAIVAELRTGCTHS
ncbi:MAG: hypothetical protein H7834_10030 [Magnetococcus sp. YQC-9]